MMLKLSGGQPKVHIQKSLFWGIFCSFCKNEVVSPNTVNVQVLLKQYYSNLITMYPMLLSWYKQNPYLTIYTSIINAQHTKFWYIWNGNNFLAGLCFNVTPSKIPHRNINYVNMTGGEWTQLPDNKFAKCSYCCLFNLIFIWVNKKYNKLGA